MSRLSRAVPGMPPAPPVRIVHLGVGNFHRAHQAWYTHHAPDAADWGIAAFTGRRPDAADALAPQDGLYTLITKSADGDAMEVVSSVAAVHRADEHDAFLGYLADPGVAVVSLTVTEAGYRRGRDGGIDLTDPVVVADIETLRTDAAAPVRSAPGKIVAGMMARRAAEAGPMTVMSCDNLPDNGDATARVVLTLAHAVDPELAAWTARHTDFASTMVDRITPATTAADLDAVRGWSGHVDVAPVPTEPFSEWVISGAFPAGRPRWEDAGAQFVDDVGIHERRKLWLLNGSHTLLAYAGSLRGHETIAEAIADPRCRTWVEHWWEEAASHLELPTHEIDTYTQALLRRYENPRVKHLLAQIAHDGSQKIPVRVVPLVVAERAAGRIPTGAGVALAAWVLHLRGHGAPIQDPTVERFRAAATSADPPRAVEAVLALLGLGEDADLAAAVTRQTLDFTADL